jgi:hypothetical protein
MKNLARLLSITVGLSLAACKGGGVDDLAKLKDEACACKDKACAEAVNKKMDDAVEKLASGGEPDKATQDKLVKLMTESGLCLAKYIK